MLAVKHFLVVVWAWLKAVPAWVWAVSGWCLAYVAWRRAGQVREQGEVEALRVEALKRKEYDILSVRERVKRSVAKAEERHERKKEELQKKSDVLDSISSDSDKVADAMNDAFGGDE